MAQESKAAEAQSATAWASSRVVRALVACSSPRSFLDVSGDTRALPAAAGPWAVFLPPEAGQRRSAAEAAAGVTFSSPSPSFSTLANKTFQASRTFPEHASEAPPLGPASSVTVAANEPASNSGVNPP